MSDKSQYAICRHDPAFRHRLLVPPHGEAAGEAHNGPNYGPGTKAWPLRDACRGACESRAAGASCKYAKFVNLEATHTSPAQADPFNAAGWVQSTQRQFCQGGTWQGPQLYTCQPSVIDPSAADWFHGHCGPRLGPERLPAAWRGKCGRGGLEH